MRPSRVWALPRALFVFAILTASLLARAQETAAAPKPGDLTAEQKAEILKSIGDVVTQRMFVPGVDFSKWPENVEKHKENLDKAPDERSFALAVNRALREFGLSHVRLRTPQAGEQRRSGPVAVGLGIQAQKGEVPGLLILGVAPASPAQKAGLGLGDTILKVDGKEPDSPAVLGGEAGTKASLEIKKKTGETVTVELARERFSTAREDKLTWNGDDAAVLKIHTFSRGYEREKIEKLVEEAAKAKYLILDLRSNGGGATNNLQHLLSLLLPNDSDYGVFVNRRMMQDYEKEKPEGPKDVFTIAKWTPRKVKTTKQRIEPFKGKIAVLTNRGSASASEICAAALREIAGAPIIGGRTAGAVLASTYARLALNWEIQYPVTDYVTIKGVRLEGNPLQPDQEVTPKPDQTEDVVLAKALETLRSVK